MVLYLYAPLWYMHFRSAFFFLFQNYCFALKVAPTSTPVLTFFWHSWKNYHFILKWQYIPLWYTRCFDHFGSTFFLLKNYCFALKCHHILMSTHAHAFSFGILSENYIALLGRWHHILFKCSPSTAACIIHVQGQRLAITDKQWNSAKTHFNQSEH